MNTRTESRREELRAEIKHAEDTLYYVANELSRERKGDPLVAECGAAAELCGAIAKVLEQRRKR